MVAFSLFWLPVYWYWIFYFLAFTFWYFFFLFVGRKYTFLERVASNLYWLLRKSPEDILLYVILWLLIGGRLGHIFIYDFSYYLQYPLKVFSFWEWGMSFIGGIIWVVLALLLLARKYHFSFRDFFLLWDLLIVPTSFGIFLWRIGNFLNQELYGRLVSDVFPSISSSLIHFFSSLNIFYIYERIDWLLRINTNFLASFFEWFFLFVLWWILLYFFLKKKSWTIGLLSSLFLSWYSLVRFLLEYLRMDSQSEYVWFFTKSQRFFLLFFIIWCFIFFRSIKSYIK